MPVRPRRTTQGGHHLTVAGQRLSPYRSRASPRPIAAGTREVCTLTGFLARAGGIHFYFWEQVTKFRDGLFTQMLTAMPSRTTISNLLRSECVDQVMRTHNGVSQLQFAALMVLDDMPGIDQRRLAEALGIAPFNAGQLVTELAALGLVDRRTNGADRRARVLRLTSHGHTLCQKLRPRNAAANRLILAALAPKERETLMDLLVRVIESNEAYACPGVGRRKQSARQIHSNNRPVSPSNKS